MVTRFVRSQLRKFKRYTATAHEIRLDDLKQKVKKIHERLLQLSVLKEIRERIESIMQELMVSTNLILEEKNIASELVGRHSTNGFFGCHPHPFIKEYGPKITSLEDLCRKNDKTLKALEADLLLYFDHKDPLLGKVQSLISRSRDLSKRGSPSFGQFFRYSSRAKTELSWISEFPRSLELCSGQFSIITQKIMDLQMALTEQSQILDGLISHRDGSLDFRSHFSDLHTLKRTLDATELMLESSAAIKQEISDVSSQLKVLASIYKEKENISMRFIRCEQFVKETISELENPLGKLQVDVDNAMKLYDEKFRRLPKDALLPEINKHVYQNVKGHSDFSWRTRKFNNRNIFPLLRTQGRGQCAYTSTISCTESLYKRFHAAISIVGGEIYQADEFTLKLSHEHLQDLVSSFRETNSRKGCNTLDYSLERMETQGVVTEEIYDRAKNFDCSRRYRIKKFEKLSTKNNEEATSTIRDGIALIANVQITTDYHRLGPNDIYDIPEGAVFETNLAGQTCSHCVVIIGYGVTPEGLPYYVFQNSYGPLWGVDGCGRVACSCLKLLYRAIV